LVKTVLEGPLVGLGMSWKRRKRRATLELLLMVMLKVDIVGEFGA